MTCIQGEIQITNSLREKSQRILFSLIISLVFIGAQVRIDYAKIEFRKIIFWLKCKLHSLSLLKFILVL